MSIEPWHLSIFVTAGIVLVELAVHALLKSVGNVAVHKRFRTVALGLLVVLTVVVAVAALGPSLADQLASVAASVAAVTAAWLAYKSHLASRGGDLSGTGAPTAREPAVPAPPEQRPAGPAERPAAGQPAAGQPAAENVTEDPPVRSAP